MPTAPARPSQKPCALDARLLPVAGGEGGRHRDGGVFPNGQIVRGGSAGRPRAAERKRGQWGPEGLCWASWVRMAGGQQMGTALASSMAPLRAGT